MISCQPGSTWAFTHTHTHGRAHCPAVRSPLGRHSISLAQSASLCTKTHSLNAMAAAAAVGADVTAGDADAMENASEPTSGLDISFTGVMSRYLASLEMAGCELERPPQQFDAHQQQRSAVIASRDCSETCHDVTETASPRRHHKVVIYQLF